MRSFAVESSSVLLALLVSSSALAFPQVGASPGSAASAGVSAQTLPPSVLRLFDPGELAFNRGPGTLPLPTNQLDLHRACVPSPVIVGWKPLPWPKYDSHRDVIFASKGLSVGFELLTIAQDGSTAPYPAAYAYGYDHHGVAPVGDGRVYFLGGGVLSYVDASDVPHLVLDPGGQPFVAPWVVTDMVYDALSNALFVLSSTIGTSGACTPPGYANAVVTKIPLNAPGNQVVGQTSVFTFCAGAADTAVARIARHADGRMLFRVAISGSTVSDVVWLDPLTMTTHWFCTQQNAPGESLSNELAYSDKFGGVVTTSTAPCFFCPPVGRLRVFTEGSAGIGQTICVWGNEARDTYWELVP